MTFTMMDDLIKLIHNLLRITLTYKRQNKTKNTDFLLGFNTNQSVVKNLEHMCIGRHNTLVQRCEIMKKITRVEK